MLRNSAAAVTKLPKNMPVLFLGGEMDEIVPPAQFRKLFELCSSDRKRMRTFPYGTHNDTCVAPGYWVEIQKWVHDDLLGLPKEDKPKRSETFDEKRVQGAEQELEGTMGAGSIAP
jgi:fermentation-respiration switch protein FrsA (DUF1100 family)